MCVHWTGYVACEAVAGCKLTHQQYGRNMMDAYCMKCRTKREVKSPEQITMKNGRPATQGTCSVCGTKVFKIGAAS